MTAPSRKRKAKKKKTAAKRRRAEKTAAPRRVAERSTPAEQTRPPLDDPAAWEFLRREDVELVTAVEYARKHLEPIRDPAEHDRALAACVTALCGRLTRIAEGRAVEDTTIVRGMEALANFNKNQAEHDRIRSGWTRDVMHTVMLQYTATQQAAVYRETAGESSAASSPEAVSGTVDNLMGELAEMVDNRIRAALEALPEARR